MNIVMIISNKKIHFLTAVFSPLFSLSHSLSLIPLSLLLPYFLFMKKDQREREREEGEREEKEGREVC